VTTVAIVERIDVFRNIGGREFSILVDLLFNTFFLQAAEEGLRYRVDAPMSTFACCVRQVRQDQGIQLADNIAFKTALDFFG
jgi:hypothetical protein